MPTIEVLFPSAWNMAWRALGFASVHQQRLRSDLLSFKVGLWCFVEDILKKLIPACCSQPICCRHILSACSFCSRFCFVSLFLVWMISYVLYLLSWLINCHPIRSITSWWHCYWNSSVERSIWYSILVEGGWPPPVACCFVYFLLAWINVFKMIFLI